MGALVLFLLQKTAALGIEGISKKELKTISKQIKATKAKTEKEKKIEQLAGKKYTKGRLARGAGIGAAMNVGAHVLGTAIEGRKGKGLKRFAPSAAKMFDPRALIRSGAIGSIYGSALPAVTRLADIEAAKRGVY
ncbi:MAG: hypothetical protein ACXAEU_17205 [Candidatus Hodarchaeales archaeon]|jgi:hypothetical protein